MEGDPGTSNFDLVAATLRADSSDAGAFAEALAAKLEQALPGKVKVQRSRSGLRGRKLVRRIELDAGELRLELVRGEGDEIECSCARVSGGIVLKREPLDTERWLQTLGQALVLEAGRSERTRQALERLLTS